MVRSTPTNVKRPLDLRRGLTYDKTTIRGVPYPTALRAKAIALRRGGYTFNEIRKALSTPTLIPKGTVGGWVRHVPLTRAQRRRIQTMMGEFSARGRALAVLAWQRKIERWKESIRVQVADLGALPFQDPAIGKLACGLLYICEGGKYPTSRHLSFANSDPRMIQLFLGLLRRYFAVDEERFRIRVMHRWDQDGKQLVQFWSGVTGISQRQFYPSSADLRTKGQRTQKHNYRGVCAVQYFDTTLQYTLQAIGENAMEWAGKYVDDRSDISSAHADRVAEPPPPPYRVAPLLAAATSTN
jgi:hypothetical protein